MKTKTLLNFYKSFYIGNFYRDFRAIGQQNINTLSFKGNHFKNFNNNKLLKWLSSANKFINRSLYSEIYPAVNFEEYNNKIKSRNNLTINKIYDRLYFDFDFSNEISKELKIKILEAININDLSLIDELRDQYIELLLNDKLAINPYNEVIKFHDYLANNNIKSYILFSGSKGFHLYIFYPATTKFKDKLINDTSLTMAKSYKNKLKLKTMDTSVNNDAYARVHRVPYTKHLITGLYCYPINIENSYTSIITKAMKPSIKDFIIKNYQNKTEFTTELVNLSKLLEKKKLEKLEAKKRLNKLRLVRNKKKGFKNDIDLSNIDCRTLANKILGSPEYTNGNLNRYSCCFHNDKNPSLSVYQDRFICGGCGVILNYYDFIAKYFGLMDSKDVIEKLKEIY